MTSLTFLYTLPAQRYETSRVEFLSFHSKWWRYASTFKQWFLTSRLNLGQNYELIRLGFCSSEFPEAENLCLNFAPAKTSRMPSKTVNLEISSFWVHFGDIDMDFTGLHSLFSGTHKCFSNDFFLPFLCECQITHGIHLHAFRLKTLGKACDLNQF